MTLQVANQLAFSHRDEESKAKRKTFRHILSCYWPAQLLTKSTWMETVVKFKYDTWYHKYMQTKNCWMQSEKNPTTFYDAIGGMPLFLFFFWNAYHSQGPPQDQLKLNYVFFFPSYSHLLISPCTWNGLTGQYISLYDSLSTVQD